MIRNKVARRAHLAHTVLLGALLAMVGSTTQARAEAQPSSEAEHLVPPQGGAVTVAVHVGVVCILSFQGKLAPQALGGSADFDVRAWGDDGVAVRAAVENAPATTLALATADGTTKVNVTLKVVPRNEPALTLVRFKSATVEEAIEAQVKAGIEKRMAPLERMRRELDTLIRKRADEAISTQVLARNEVVRIEAHARNDDHAIVHVRRALLLGDDAYLVFEIQNRGSAAFRLASAHVLVDRRVLTSEARLSSPRLVSDPALIGVVPAGATVRGVVTIRNAVLNRSLVLELAQPGGRGGIRVDRGVVLR